jgi:ATP synthase protein I
LLRHSVGTVCPQAESADPSRATSESSYPLEFFFGEAIKILSTIGLLAFCHYLVPDLMWGWFLGGLAVTLQAGFFAFLFKH